MESKKPESGSNILEVNGLSTYFYSIHGVAKAVNNVSFSLKRGEILGIVGESGCGKSVTSLSIVRLIQSPPGKIVEGEIIFDGTNLLALTEQEMRDIRGAKISMIFQEPMTSLNPLYTIGNQISEMFIRHNGYDRKKAMAESVEMLKKVQIPNAEARVREYPHQMSGGMRQRVMIAMALACNPEILIADEPSTALDVTIQAQVLDLMLQLKKTYETAIILITHDLGVIAEVAEKVAVMYAGQIVEEAQVEAIFDDPLHPYTRSLLKSIPILGERFEKEGRVELNEIKGIVPSLYSLPKGCNFSPRCPEAQPKCNEAAIPIILTTDNRQVRCILHKGAHLD
jgi:peptide/nickel transport system ATP-binding protein/oligopeptide transport system ATP-binding protein